MHPKLQKILLSSRWESHLEIHSYFLDESKRALQSVCLNEYQEGFKIFSELYKRLMAHILFEEEFVLPLFKHIENTKPFTKAEYYDRDHKQLKIQLLDVLIAVCFSESPEHLALKMAQCIDLMEHHDTREAEGLYADLNASLSEAEKAFILEHFSCHQRAVLNSDNLFFLLVQTADSWKKLKQKVIKKEFADLKDFYKCIQKLEQTQTAQALVSQIKKISKQLQKEELLETVLTLKKVESLILSLFKNVMVGPS